MQQDKTEKISTVVSEAVLTVGQSFRRPRGGISSVINTYSSHFAPFKFITTYNPRFGKYINILHFLGSLFPLTFKLLIDRDIRIIHLHAAERGSIFRKYVVMIIAKSMFGKRVIFHSHGAELHLFYDNGNWMVKRVLREFLHKVDLIICLSQQCRSFFESNFHVESVEILENIVEKAETSSVPEQGAVPKVLRLLFLGEIGERKGVFDLISVLITHKQDLEGKVHLKIGGKGEVEKLLSLISEHNLEQMVSFEGWVSGRKKDDLLRGSDIFILPSYNEGLPISILEALSYGLPVVSTRVGGIPEVVHDEINGFITAPGDVVRLFESIVRFVVEPELSKRMGENSLRIVGPYYSNAVIPKLEKIYLSVMSDN